MNSRKETVRIEALFDRAGAVLLICAAAAAMDELIPDEGGALTFRSLCALAIAVSAFRLISGLFG
ncbi:MAG: hypothetical protein IJ124_06250 [Clostridia bacterium]|nr:hypothetical protein [Clostridia bacterium]